MTRFSLAAAAWIAAGVVLAGAQWLVMISAPGASWLALFFDMDIVAKLATLLTVLVGAAGAVAALAASGSAGGRQVSFALAGVAVALGAAGGGWTWAMAQAADRAMGGVALEVIAPSYAEAALSLGLGLLAAAVTLTIQALRRPGGYADAETEAGL